MATQYVDVHKKIKLNMALPSGHLFIMFMPIYNKNIIFG